MLRVDREAGEDTLGAACRFLWAESDYDLEVARMAESVEGST